MADAAAVESLNERERLCLEHVRQAQELGVSYAEFCRSFDLNVTEWYPVRQALVRKGLVAGRGKSEDEEKSAGFAPVRVMATAGAAVVCRLRHPCGWTIECMSWPEASWIAALMAVGQEP